MKQTSAALIMVLASFGCPAFGDAKETVTLYYWGYENDLIAPDLIQDFENQHDGRNGQPSIKVIMAQAASVNRTNDPQRLLCGIAGGDPPDVVWFDRFAVGEWASRGGIHEFAAVH